VDRTVLSFWRTGQSPSGRPWQTHWRAWTDQQS